MNNARKVGLTPNRNHADLVARLCALKHTHTHTHIQTHINTRMHAQAYTRTHTYIHKHTHTYTRTHIHTHIPLHHIVLAAAVRSYYILLFQAPFVAESIFKVFDYKQLGDLWAPGTPCGTVSKTGMSSADIEWMKWAFGKPGADCMGVKKTRCRLHRDSVNKLWNV